MCLFYGLHRTSHGTRTMGHIGNEMSLSLPCHWKTEPHAKRGPTHRQLCRMTCKSHPMLADFLCDSDCQIHRGNSPCVTMDVGQRLNANCPTITDQQENSERGLITAARRHAESWAYVARLQISLSTADHQQKIPLLTN
jgi:hypothetical protein